MKKERILYNIHIKANTQEEEQTLHFVCQHIRRRWLNAKKVLPKAKGHCTSARHRPAVPIRKKMQSMPRT